MVSDVCEHFDSHSKYVTSAPFFFFAQHQTGQKCENAAKPGFRIKVGTHEGNIRMEWSQELKSIRGSQNLFSANGPMNSDLFEFLEPFAGNGHLK